MQACDNKGCQGISTRYRLGPYTWMKCQRCGSLRPVQKGEPSPRITNYVERLRLKREIAYDRWVAARVSPGFWALGRARWYLFCGWDRAYHDAIRASMGGAK